jgi:hypothetical protein
MISGPGLRLSWRMLPWNCPWLATLTKIRSSNWLGDTWGPCLGGTTTWNHPGMTCPAFLREVSSGSTWKVRSPKPWSLPHGRRMIFGISVVPAGYLSLPMCFPSVSGSGFEKSSGLLILPMPLTGQAGHTPVMVFPGVCQRRSGSDRHGLGGSQCHCRRSGPQRRYRG